MCGIQARLFTPKVDRPDRGYLVPSVELPALCSSKNFTSSGGGSSQSSSVSGVSGGGGGGGGGASGKSQSGGSQTVEQTQSMLSQLMLDILNESKCVDDRSLCIASGKLAWALYIDLICLNHEGNVQDACVLAMISALRTVRLPEVGLVDVEEDGTGGQIKLTYPIKYTQIKLNCEPVCTTMFAIETQGGVVLLSDPNKLEEDFARTFLLVCTLNDTQMCLVRKLGGGLGMSQQQLELCISRALENGTHVRRNVFNSI